MFENMFLFVYIHVQHCEQCIFWIIHTIPEIEKPFFGNFDLKCTNFWSVILIEYNYDDQRMTFLTRK